MAIVEIKLPHHRYPVVIEPGLLSRLGTLTRDAAPHDLAALFSDGNVAETFGRSASNALQQAGYAVTSHALSPGESYKTLDTVRALYDVMLDGRLERRSPVVAVGGGVTGDTAGFVAASYLRGVPFVQCPTTLLAMVDASVGGKVGVNLPRGKNLVGAFHQPALVAIDTDTLKTLPPRELRCGLAECVKHGVIRDADLFSWIESNVDSILGLDSDTLVELVRRNVAIKAAVVMEDEKESGVRAHLNFGHTFAHAIEASQSYGADTGDAAFHHGEAVSLGMVAATKLAIDAGRCDADLLSRLVALLERIGLPTHADNLAPTDQLIDSMRLDKKVADGRIRLVLPDRLGNVFISSDADDDAIRAAWSAVAK